jgi:hypothetical protein
MLEDVADGGVTLLFHGCRFLLASLSTDDCKG